MATIKIDSTVMREKSSSFKTIASSINSLMEDMKQEIDGLRSVWEGESAETTVRKFQAYNTRFENMYTTINNYATFLEQAADAYDQSDQRVKQAAEGQ